MSNQAPFWTKPYLYLLLHSGSGVPQAVRVNTKKLIGLIAIVAITFAFTVLGTLLFFREMEFNRQLEEKVLTFETRAKVSQALRQAGVPVAGDAAANAAKEEADEIRLLATVSSAKSNTKGAARIADLNTRCQTGSCTVNLSMVPATPGVASGAMLVILETEIPRIGRATAGSKVRKRYFFYPGYQSRDHLSRSELDRLDKQPFRFSRALRTTANFKLGKLLRPLAVNVYLFDKKGNAIHHERRTLEGDS